MRLPSAIPQQAIQFAFAERAGGQSANRTDIRGANSGGANALFSRTTGGFNTGVGLLSLRSFTTGNFNTRSLVTIVLV
jgi:hypothetical protein